MCSVSFGAQGTLPAGSGAQHIEKAITWCFCRRETSIPLMIYHQFLNCWKLCGFTHFPSAVTVILGKLWSRTLWGTVNPSDTVHSAHKGHRLSDTGHLWASTLTWDEPFLGMGGEFSLHGPFSHQSLCWDYQKERHNAKSDQFWGMDTHSFISGPSLQSSFHTEHCMITTQW